MILVFLYRGDNLESKWSYKTAKYNKTNPIQLYQTRKNKGYENGQWTLQI